MTESMVTAADPAGCVHAGEPALVVRCVGGYAWVELPDKQRLVARPRGRLRRQVRLRVGDRVTVRPDGQPADEGSPTEWIVEAVEPRQTWLERPPIANVSQILLVNPLPLDEGALRWIDQVAVAVQQQGIDLLLAFTKTDTADRQAAAQAVELYSHAGYRALAVCAPRGDGLAQLRSWLQDRITALAGPSGAGKSTLVNALIPGLDLATGELSRRNGRGRQTTREVQLFALPWSGGWIADTPGFGALDLQPMDPADLAGYFPELALVPACPHFGCQHDQEQGCRVRAAVAAGQVAPSRYEHYRALLAWARREWHRRYDRAPRGGSRGVRPGSAWRGKGETDA